MKKKIKIIIVDWNSVEVTRNCLGSLMQINLMDRFELEIILVDNGSNNSVKDLLVIEFPSIKYLRNDSNLGFTGGNNTGIRYALESKTDYILLLNNDTTVEPDFLEKLFDFMESNPDAGAVQPKIFFEHNRALLWNGGNGFFKLFGHTYVHGYNKESSEKYNNVKEQPWLTACAMMLNVSLLKDPSLLMLNEKYFTNYEDVELSFRVRKAGYKLYYVPQSVVYHVAGYSTNTRQKTKEGYTHPFMVYMNSRNRLFVVREYSPWYFLPTIILFHICYYVLLLTYFLALRRTQKFKKVLHAIRDGVFGDFRLNV
jgi:GT2 family glycosyltransferase